MSTSDKFEHVSPLVWWNNRRFQYNIGLVYFGIFSFLLYAIICFTLSNKYPDIEITIFTILFQGIGYLFMIGLANIFYFIGPISECIINPSNTEHYRNICFRLGFWGSVFLPFCIPLSLIYLSIFHPNHFS